MLSVTNIGLGAIANAQAGGFLINLAGFKVSEYDVSGLSSVDFITTEDMRGTPVFSAQVTTIEVVDTSAVRLTFTIPVSVPAVGVWNLREVGVYLETGELFAYGPLEPAYEKSSEFSIKVYVLVVANRLSETINVVVSNNNSLPIVPYVKSLVQPANTYQNAIIVLDEFVNDYADASTASLALKSGPGGAQWAFVGYNRIYTGEIDSVIDPSSFALSPDRGGFWLNDGEIVIAQIISGLGSGFSRKLSFDKSTNTFTVVDKDWAQLASTSHVAIWRNLKNQLPARDADMEEYLVLGVGENTWNSTIQAYSPTKYVSHFANGLLDAQGKFSSSFLTGADSLSTYVFVAGKCLPPGTFFVISDQVQAPGYAGQAVEVYAFIKETATVGGMLTKFESSYPTDGVTSRYYLPIVPDSSAWVSVYINDAYVGVAEYGFEPTSIVFTNPPAAGTLRIASFATYEDNNASTEVKRYFYQAIEGGTRTFDVDAELFEKNRVALYVAGQYYGEEDFTIGTGTITLLKTPLYVTGAATVDISVFTSVINTSVQTYEGTDTGPVWTDPAGRMGPPNVLVPKVNSYVSDGARLNYLVYAVPRKENIVMIAGGAHQDPHNYTYTKGTKAQPFGTLTLTTPIPFGVPIDFICFTDVKDSGTSAVCEVFNFVTTSSLSYTINPVANVEAIFVVIGGTYHHHGSFHITNGDTLNLQSVVPNQEAEIWYFKTTPHAGWRTEMHVEFDHTNSINKYMLSKRVEREENTLTFLSSVYQNKNKYSIVEADYMQQVTYDTALPPAMYDLSIITVYFVSGPPLTRLMLREDGDAYMPRHGPHVEWSNLSYRLRNMLACPITKLLALLTGSMEAEFNNGSASDKDLALKYGLQPVTKNLVMQVLPTASYAGMGPGAMLGAKSQFNVYKYLEIFLKQELGNASFTIHSYEQGVKYFIDDIKLGSMTYDSVARADIPMITYSTGIYINYPNALLGTTYPGVPLLTNFFDMGWSRDHVLLPAGFTIGNTTIRTQSVTYLEDDSTQTRTFVHTIVNGFTGSTHVVKWSRPYTVSNQNIEYMTLVDGGGSPGYVQYFARLYAQWKYNDLDIVKCMYFNKQINVGGISADGAPYDAAWLSWLGIVRSGQYGNYPASAGYTAGLAFGVVVDNFDSTTGNCDLLIQMTSGTIGYSYFPADMLIKNIQIPVSYTIYPAISVNPDGTITPMISNEDLFKSCCWTDFTPAPVLDCGSASSPSIPTVSSMITANSKPIIKGTYHSAFARTLSVTVGGQTFVKGVSPALSTLANAWELDLAATAVSLAIGFHDVVVSVVLEDNSILLDESSNEIFVNVIADVTAPNAPTVTTHTYGNTTPIVVGTYPSNDAEGGFTVSINDWIYTLNGTLTRSLTNSLNTRTLQYAPLTAIGNNWSLDMSKDTGNVLTYKTYSVTALVLDGAGNIATDLTANEAILIQPTPTTVAYTTNGTYSLVIPANITTLTIDGLYGAGAGSGACNNDGDAWVGGGGGSGGKVVGTTIAVTPGETLTIIVGKRGFGASYRFNGNYAYNYTDTGATVGLDTGTAGGTTSIMRGSTVLLSATGGAPGSQFGRGAGGSPAGGAGQWPTGQNGYTGPYAGGSNGSGIPPSGHGSSWIAGTGTGYGNGGGESGLGQGCNGQDGAVLASYIIPIF